MLETESEERQTDTGLKRKTQKLLKKSKEINYRIIEIIHAKFLGFFVYNIKISRKRIVPQRYKIIIHFAINICVDKQRL
jgi:hypothetical protein